MKGARDDENWMESECGASGRADACYADRSGGLGRATDHSRGGQGRGTSTAMGGRRDEISHRERMAVNQSALDGESKPCEYALKCDNWVLSDMNHYDLYREIMTHNPYTIAR